MLWRTGSLLFKSSFRLCHAPTVGKALCTSRTGLFSLTKDGSWSLTVSGSACCGDSSRCGHDSHFMNVKRNVQVNFRAMILRHSNTHQCEAGKEKNHRSRENFIQVLGSVLFHAGPPLCLGWGCSLYWVHLKDPLAFIAWASVPCCLAISPAKY